MEGMTELGPRIIVRFGDSGVFITETVIWGVIVAFILGSLAVWAGRNLQRIPRGKQIWAEVVVEFAYKLVSGAMGRHNMLTFAPYFGTVIIFILFSNMLGLFGLRPATTDVNMTFALSLSTFIIMQYVGIKSMGFGGKLKHMAQPMAFLFPIKIIEQVALPISLGFRLFGNILGGMIIMELLYSALASATVNVTAIPFLNFVIPLPANAFFDIFEPVLQAYIFTMLSMVFVSQEIIVREVTGKSISEPQTKEHLEAPDASDARLPH